MTSWANLICVGLGRGSSHPGSPVPPYPTSSKPYHAIDISINHLLTLPPTCTPPLSLIHSPSSSLPTRSPPSHILKSYMSISNYLSGHAPLHNPSHIKPPQTLHSCSCDYSPFLPLFPLPVQSLSPLSWPPPQEHTQMLHQHANAPIPMMRRRTHPN